MQEIGQGLNSAFEWMTRYNASLTLLFSCTVAIATVVYAMLTRALVRETIQLRRAGTNPDIAIYFEPDEKSISIVTLVIRNIGSGPAYRLAFTVEQAPPINATISNRLSEIALFNGFKYMAPGRELRYFFGMGWELMQEPAAGAVTITVTYESKTGEHQRESFALDLRDYNGMMQIGTPPLYDIAKHTKNLENIAKTLERIQRRQERQDLQGRQAIAAASSEASGSLVPQDVNKTQDSIAGNTNIAAWWRQFRHLWERIA